MGLEARTIKSTGVNPQEVANALKKQYGLSKNEAKKRAVTLIAVTGAQTRETAGKTKVVS